MSFGDSIRTCYSKYLDPKGRAARPEFWWFALFAFIVEVIFEILLIIAQSLAVDAVGSIVLLIAIGVPSITVAVRRLHDLDRTGWWWWLGLLPVIGTIILIVWYCGRGTPGPNRYGPPTDGAPAAAAG